VIFRRVIFFAFFQLSLCVQLKAQAISSVSREEHGMLKTQAVQRIQELEGWMQYISQKGTTSADVQDAIAMIQENALFFDSLVTLEDDLFALRADTMFPRDVSVAQYINDLHLFYNKSTDGKSVVFSDLRLTDLIQKDYLYLKVFYLAKYRERHRDFDENYPVRRRVATIRLDKDGKDWKVRIAGVGFLKEKSADGRVISQEEFEKEFKPFAREPKNKLPSFKEAGGDSIEFTQIQLRLQREFDSLYAENVKSKLAESEALKRKEDLFKSALAKGDSLFSAGNFPEAIEAFTEARAQKPFETYPRDKIRELGKLMLDTKSNPAEVLKNQIAIARQKMRLRDYEAALEEFQVAAKLAPDDSLVRGEINQIDLMLRNRDQKRALYTGGNTRMALKAYEKEFSQNKENPDFYFERGRCYQLAGERKKALFDLSKAILLDANYRDALVFRSEIYLKENNYSDAIADYTALTVLDNTNPEHYFRKAIALQKNNDLDAAARFLDQAISMQPENPEYLVARATLYRLVKGFDDGLKLVDKAISIRSAYPDAYFEKGMILLEQGEEKEAALAILKARRLGLGQAQTKVLDDRAKEFENQAIVAEKQKAVEKALGLWKKYLIFKPNHPPVLLKIAELYSVLDQVSDALQLVNKALFYKADLVNGYLLKGDLLLRSGDGRASLEPFYKARKYDPKSPAASLGIGKSFAQFLNYDSAMIWFSESIRLEPDLAEAYLCRGVCHYQKENYVRALDDLEKAQKKDGKLAEAHFFKGLVFKAYKRFDEAIDELKDAISGGFRLYEANIEIGICFEKLEKNSRARQFYTNAIAQNRDLAPAYILKGMSNLKDGNRKEAMADLDEGLKIDTALSKADYRVELGYLHLEFEEPEKAEACFRKALDFDEFHPKGNFGLGVCLYNRREPDAALRYVEQALLAKKITASEIKELPGTKKIFKDKKYKELKNRYLD
jgi:tetratricopeptide (TPR) repeat protein